MSKENPGSLADFISFSDEVTIEPNTDIDDTSINNNDNDDDDSHDDDGDQDAGQEGIDNDDSFNDNNSNDYGDSSEFNLTTLFEDLKKEGVIAVSDDFTFDGTPKQLNEVIDKTFEELTIKAQSALMESVPEDVRDLLRYTLTTKKGIADYLSEQSSIPSIDNIDLSVEENQEYVVRQLYKQTSKYSDEKIDKLINRAKDLGELDLDAREAQQELLNLKAEEDLTKEKAFKDHQDLIRQNEAKERALYEELIKEDKTIEEKRKSNLKSFLVNKSRTVEDNSLKTGFSRTLEQISKNPTHILQLADVLLDYNKDKGFTFDRLTRKKETQHNKNILDKIKETNPGEKMRGMSSTKRKVDFDFTQWAMMD